MGVTFVVKELKTKVFSGKVSSALDQFSSVRGDPIRCFYVEVKQYRQAYVQIAYGLTGKEMSVKH